MKTIKSICLVILVAFTQSPVFAKDFIVATVGCYHYDREMVHNQNLNEHNKGFGYEWEEDDYHVMVGFYKNSYYRDSKYAVVGYTPIKVGDVKIGAATGLVTGYKEGSAIALASALVEYEYKGGWCQFDCCSDCYIPSPEICWIHWRSS